MLLQPVTVDCESSEQELMEWFLEIENQYHE
jgi:hypothetical protein